MIDCSSSALTSACLAMSSRNSVGPDVGVYPLVAVDLGLHLEVLLPGLEPRAHPALPSHHVLALLVVVGEVREVEAEEGHDVGARGSDHLLRVEVPDSDSDHQLGRHRWLEVDLGLTVQGEDVLGGGARGWEGLQAERDLGGEGQSAREWRSCGS